MPVQIPRRAAALVSSPTGTPVLYRGEIIWAGPVSDIDSSHNEYVEQFINGLAEGPIQMEVLKT